MLQGFYLQAKETKDLLFEIKEEYFRLKRFLKNNHKNIYSSDLVDALSAYPIITAAKLAEKLSCTWATASEYLKTLKEAGLFTSRKVGKYHFYMYTDLLKILYQ
jgi:predicted transcriptional regulator